MKSLPAQLRALWMRILGVLRPARADADFHAELESHIAMHTDDFVRAGLTPVEARRQALIRLGGVEQARQAHRERRVLPQVESIVRDLAYGARSLRKNPTITAIAVLSIGLGIGANATIFSMISRFVLRPPPVGDPSTLLSLHTTRTGEPCCNDFSLPMFIDVREQARSFSGVAAYYELLPASIGGAGEPQRIWGQAVSTNFFGVTRVPLILGRGFIDGEERQPKVVLGAGLWQRRFNGDKDIVGKSVILSGRTFTVVGVASGLFHSVDQILYTEFWVPLGNAEQMAPGLSNQGSRDFHWLSVVGRMKSGVKREQVAAELNTMAHRLAKVYPKTDKDGGFAFEQAGTLPQNVRSTVFVFLTALGIAVALVLFIAGANVANLLFAQTAGRQGDMAVRLALGATRGRLQRQVLTESLLLGLGGGLLGIVLSLWSTSALSAFHIPAPVPLQFGIHVDWRVLSYAFVLSVLSGLLLGIGPAWAAARPSLAHALKGEDALARPGRRISFRNLLVIAQIGMSVVLLCLTGLSLRSLQTASHINIGFRSQNLLLMSVDPRVHGYTPERTVMFLTELQKRVTALPGVVSAIATDTAPLSGGGRSDAFQADDLLSRGKSEAGADLYMVTPGYFETMGIARIAGRDFGDETANGPKVAIVNRAFVDRIFGGENPLGRHVTGGGVTYEVIGVSGNTKSRTLGEEQRAVLYRSLQQSIAGDPALMGNTLVVRTAGNPATIKEAVRLQIHALDPAMAVFNEETMEEHVRTAFFLPHLAAALFGVFGAIGLVLATVGLYGVMSYAVSRRTREIGIRMAMGARPGTVERLVLRQGFLLTLIAVGLGWPAAWMLAKLASRFLYGIQPHDIVTFVLVPPFLIAVSAIACWIPARRAASIDPMQALRTE